jgi:flagellar basal body P-ring formation protein FlgA
MTRILGSLLLLATVALAAERAAAEPMLRPAVTVEGAVIRLGDLFGDAGAASADVVAPAPPPGSRTIFNAAWLAAAAREHKLAWEPASRFDQAVVERATRAIGAETIAARLLQDIAQRQAGEDFELQLDDRALRLLVPAEAPDAIAVDDLSLDTRNGRFAAVVTAPAGSAEATPRRITGRLIRMIALPVLDRAMMPGDTITARDVTTARLGAERVAADALADARELVGKTPRRPLRANEPLRPGDIQAPLVLHKGDLVTIVLETPTMRLTAEGKALDDGAMGAAIHVANTKSGRVIDARVAGANTVTVDTRPLVAQR